MKKIVCFVLLAASLPAMANKEILDGDSFCRASASGHYESSANDCIEFSNGMATDYGPMAYGNRALEYEYRADKLGQGVLIITFGNSLYEVSKDGTSIMEIRGSRSQGAILKKSN